MFTFIRLQTSLLVTWVCIVFTANMIRFTYTLSKKASGRHILTNEHYNTSRPLYFLYFYGNS